MKYILICSDEAKWRKEGAIEHLQSKGITDLLLAPAYYLKSLPPDTNEKEWCSQYKKGHLGKIGCDFAHANAIDLSCYFDDHVMIFEDDVFLNDNYEKHIDHILKILEEESPAIIHLTNHKKKINMKDPIIRKPKKHVCNQAYIVHKEFKLFILDYISRYYGAIDRVFLNMREWVKVYQTIHIASQNRGPSTNWRKGFAKRPDGWKPKS